MLRNPEASCDSKGKVPSPFELADHQIAQIEDILDVGDEIYVKCIDISRDGKIRLSRREAVSEG